MNIWIVSAAVSMIGHGAFALWLGAHDPAPTKPKPPTVVRFEAWRPEPPKPPPPPPPKVEPPPPPKTLPPKVVKKPSPRPVAPEPPASTQTHVEEPKNSAITPDQTTTGGDLTTTTGDGLAGPVNDKHGTAPPETPPAPPAPPPKPKTVYVPIVEVSQLPVPIDAVQPEVPEEWKTSGRDAVVVVEVAINADGRVVDARVVKKAGHGLDEAAVIAAKKTRFEPARVGSKAVAVRMQLPYRFKVRG